MRKEAKEWRIERGRCRKREVSPTILKRRRPEQAERWKLGITAQDTERVHGNGVRLWERTVNEASSLGKPIRLNFFTF
jgi:hypothetical protein